MISPNGAGRSRKKDGKTGSRRALRARDGSRRGRRGCPVLQEPVLGAAACEHRNRRGIRGVLSEVPEASMSAAFVSLGVECRWGSGHWEGEPMSGD